MPQAFDQALNAELDYAEPVIFWDSCTDLAALDFDPVAGCELDLAQLLTLEGIPVPIYSWITKGGGLRLIYTSQEPFTAEEIAAVAYLSLMAKPYQSIEIKHETRHPKYEARDGTNCSEVIIRQQQFEPHHLQRWLHMYSVLDQEVQDFLESVGMQANVQYDHSHCPAAPDRASHGKPVIALEKGIFCHSCEAYGLTLGSTRPGFFPYTHLCGSRGSSVVYKCMEGKVHWEHARYVLADKLNITGHYASLIYTAGLLLHGHDRKTVDKVMRAGRNFIRMADRWTNLNGEIYGRDIKPILSTLPACQIGKLVDRAKVTLFEQSFDLGAYGYPSIKPVYGIKIQPQADTKITAVIQTRHLCDEGMIKFRPAYTKNRSDPWSTVEQVFPGINRRFIKLLIAARGIAEGGISMPPIIFVTGPTGAGKTFSVFLAASICGDTNTEVVWTPNTDRLRQSIIDAGGTFVTFNEVFKEAKTALQAMDFLLNLTPDSVSHYMYVGPAKMGPLPVLVLTDTELLARVKQDAQLARRLVHVHLTEPVDWEPTFKRHGLTHPSVYRCLSTVTADACNQILSEVMDEFFQSPKSFTEIAADLGFTRLANSTEANEAKLLLIRLFQQAINEAEPVEPTWKIIRRDIETPLQQLWLAVCDEDFISARRCTEVSWGKILGLTESVIFESRAHGVNKVAIRWRSIDHSKFNKELL